MGKTTLDKGQLKLTLEQQRNQKPLKLKKPSKKDTVSRREFYEAARTLEPRIVIGVSEGEINFDGKWVSSCLLQVDTPEDLGHMTVAYLSDSQVRELIQVLRDYLSAKGEK